MEGMSNARGKSKELPNDGCSRDNNIFLPFASKSAFPLADSALICEMKYRG